MMQIQYARHTLRNARGDLKKAAHCLSRDREQVIAPDGRTTVCLSKPSFPTACIAFPSPQSGFLRWTAQANKKGPLRRAGRAFRRRNPPLKARAAYRPAWRVQRPGNSVLALFPFRRRWRRAARYDDADRLPAVRGRPHGPEFNRCAVAVSPSAESRSAASALDRPAPKYRPGASRHYRAAIRSDASERPAGLGGPGRAAVAIPANLDRDAGRPRGCHTRIDRRARR